MQYFGGIAFILLSVVGLGVAEILPPFLQPEVKSLARYGDVQVFQEDGVNYRLPNDTLPEKYTLELTTNIHSGDTNFTGVVAIDLRVVTQTSKIVLHARQLRNFVASIIRTDSNTMATSRALTYTYEDVTEFLTFSATGLTFPAGSKWRLTISYSGTLRTDNGGFYVSTYQDENNTVHYLATTQFESTDARHGFPCYDEPAKRADYDITINHDPSYFAMSNMPVDSTKSTSGRTVFQTLKSCPSYLVAYIVSDFVYSEGVLNSLPQRVYSRRGTESSQEFPLLSALVMIERLNEYYGLRFPLPKLDIVAVPDFAAGAMENWGLTTYREEYSLYNALSSTTSTQNNAASTIAHEYCHQWFGDLVAIEWWSVLWMKESFATLFEYQITNATYPEWDFYQVYQVGAYASALRTDASATIRPMTYYVEKPSSISNLYDRIAYDKGGAVLHMWQHALTDKVFRRGLRNYLETNQYSTGNERALFEAMRIAAAEENFALPAQMADMLSSWTRQSNYPVLTVTRNYRDGSFTIQQNAFFSNPSVTDTKMWYIPTNFVTQSNPDFRDTTATHYLLKQRQISVNGNVSANDWLILNKKSTGYYRINYDTQNWDLIIDGLLEKPYEINVHNRAQFITDIYYFIITNRLDHSYLLKLLTYLSKEDQYAPLYNAYAVFNTMNAYLNGDSNYTYFQEYISDLVKDTFEKFGVNEDPSEPHLTPSTRNVLINLACMAGVPSCYQSMTQKLKNFLEKQIPIEPNLYRVTYCNGLKDASDATFNTVYNMLMNSDDQAYRGTLIASLGCSLNSNQIDKLLKSSIDQSNKLRTQERNTVLSAVYSGSTVGVLRSIEFLQQNWDTYSSITAGFSGGNPAQDDLVGLAAYVTNSEQADKMNSLIDSLGSKLSNSVAQRVRTQLQSNFNWLQTNRDPFMKWVESYVAKKSASTATTSPSTSTTTSTKTTQKTTTTTTARPPTTTPSTSGAVFISVSLSAMFTVLLHKLL